MKRLSVRQRKVPKFVFRECKQMVYAFCRIMGYADTDVYSVDIFFIGDNPFNLVCINDDWWNMYDIYYVISNFDILYNKYENDLPMVIFDWYNYNIENTSPYKINLISWLLGKRQTEQKTSEEYKKMMGEELKKSRQRVEEAMEDLQKCIDELEK